MSPKPTTALLALAIPLLGPAPAAGQGVGQGVGQGMAPAVHVIATGGTIASRGGASGPLTGENLVRAVAGIERVASLTVEQFINVGSSQITPEHWRGLAERIREILRADPDLRGVVVTHGTDTMEETAYFLHLTVADDRPVVLTGSMRPADAIGADGPANLYNAVRLAVAPGAAGRGTLVLMNDEVYSARDVTKVNTSRADAFVAPDAGAVGVADPDAIVFTRPPDRRGAGGFDLAELGPLPRVDIVYSYAGADGATIRAALEAGARGIVVATVGRGNVPAAQREAIREAVERVVVVVLSSRTGGGRVPVDRGSPAERSTGPGAVIGAGDLNPQKARVLLMLTLARNPDPREIAEAFRSH